MYSIRIIDQRVLQSKLLHGIKAFLIRKFLHYPNGVFHHNNIDLLLPLKFLILLVSSNGHSVMMFTSNRGKNDYLNGESPELNSTDLKYKTWKAEHNMVMSWLVIP